MGIIIISDPKDIGVPNICFSLTEKDDNREPEFREQRLNRGFDDSETWSLRDTIGNFTLPRLKRYREIVQDTIEDNDGFFAEIDKAIIAFELLVRDNGSFILNEEEQKQYVDGMESYHKIFLSLWW